VCNGHRAPAQHQRALGAVDLSDASVVRLSLDSILFVCAALFFSASCKKTTKKIEMFFFFFFFSFYRARLNTKNATFAFASLIVRVNRTSSSLQTRPNATPGCA
jgi:hypothetical protein